MIIFNLDGTLADCENRRHFVDPKKSNDPDIGPFLKLENGNKEGSLVYGHGYNDGVFKNWKPDWKSFYEACDKDEPIEPVINIFLKIKECNHIEIWSGRCESVRVKTEAWLTKYASCFFDYSTNWHDVLKMRPIGDNIPDDQLKEKWLDEVIEEDKNIDFVFDSCPNSIEMWRRRGIFVFNCCQHDREF